MKVITTLNTKKIENPKLKFWGLMVMGAIIPSFFLRPYVIMELWNWFVSPLGVHVISFWWAFGLLLFAQLLLIRLRFEKLPDKDEDNYEEKMLKDMKETFGFLIQIPLITLVLGYCIHVWLI